MGEEVVKEFRELFNINWQRKFVKILVRSEKAASMALGVLKPYFIEDPLFAVITGFILDYVEEYQEVPGKEMLVADVNISADRNDIKQDVRVEKVRDEIVEIINDIYSDEVTEGEIKLSIKHFKEFVTTQTIKKEIIKIAKKINKGETEDLSQDVSDMFSNVGLVGVDKSDLGIRFVEAANLMREKMYDFLETEDTVLFPQLDKAVGNGFGYGKIYTIMAPLKGGKSTALINLGHSFMLNGLTVLDVSLEMNRFNRLSRYASIMMPEGTDWKDIAKDESLIDEFEKTLETIKSIYGGGELICKDFPSQTMTIADLRAYVMLVKLRGFDPDVLILDYPEEGRLPGRDKRYIEVANFFRAFRGLCQENNMIGLTATQANRQALSKYKPEKDDIATALEKGAVSDAIVAIAMTDEEQELGVGRFYLVAGRDNSYRRPIWFKHDLKRCKLREIPRDDVEMELPSEIYRKVYGASH